MADMIFHTDAEDLPLDEIVIRFHVGLSGGGCLGGCPSRRPHANRTLGFHTRPHPTLILPTIDQTHPYNEQPPDPTAPYVWKTNTTADIRYHHVSCPAT